MFVVDNLEKVLTDILSMESVQNVLISGAPGIGKSQITSQVAEKLGLKILDVRLYEQGESAAGLPTLNEETNETRFTMPWWLKQVIEEKIDVLFFDDFHLVPHAIQQFLYKLLTHRQLHDYLIEHPIKIVLAGNFEIESANAIEVQSPIMDRIQIAIKYKPTLETYREYMLEKQFRPEIYALLHLEPQLLYTEDPEPNTKFPSPRGWEELNNMLNEFERLRGKLDRDTVLLLATSRVGEKAGSLLAEAFDYLKFDPREILKEPVPEDKKEQYYRGIAVVNDFLQKFYKTEDRTRLIDIELPKVSEYITKLYPEIGASLALYLIRSIRKDTKASIHYVKVATKNEKLKKLNELLGIV